MLEVPLERLAVEEGAAYGAALLGGVAPYAAPSSTASRSSGTEHRRDDLQPQLAAGAAARHAAALAASDQIERVAQTARNALEHGAHERAAVVANLEPGERAAGVRIGVRSAFAGQVRQEREAVDARVPLRRFLGQRTELAADHAAQPRQRAGC